MLLPAIPPNNQKGRDMSSQYLRLSAGIGGGVKLCGRAHVNPTLSPTDALDVERFRRKLEARFGRPDHVADADYSYSVRDNLTGVEFEAYSAQSGPAYGGAPADSFVDFDQDDYRIKPEVFRTLAAFDAWLEGGQP